MAKKVESVAPAQSRSNSINLDASQGRSALAAWKMIYHLYGARVEAWGDPTPDGITATGFTVNGDNDPETVIKDISSRNRRLDLLSTYGWLQGNAPEHYADAAEITADTVQFYKGSVDEGSAKSPAYVKTAVANYKAANHLAKKRGPKAKVIHLDKMSEFDESVLQTLDSESISLLQAALTRAAQTKAPVQEAMPV